MQYKEIVAVSGLGGLYQLLSNKSDGAIVRSLEDNTAKFVASRIHHITPLESIEVFTKGENVTLAEIFKVIQQQEKETPLPGSSQADSAALKAYFGKIYPDLDNERVYVSDMKKMLKWYLILKANDLLKFDEPKPEEENKEAVEAAVPVEEDKATRAAVTAGPAETPKEQVTGKKTATASAGEQEQPAKQKKTGGRKKKSEAD